MKKLFPFLFLFFSYTTFAQVFDVNVASGGIRFDVPATHSGSAFTVTATFIPNPAYTTYSIGVYSVLKPYWSSSYKYTTISSVQLKDSSGNIIPVTWTHVQATIGTFSLDDWCACTGSYITGLSNGQAYSVVIQGTGYSVGVDDNITAPFSVILTSR